jgi:hypothetical protein
MELACHRSRPHRAPGPILAYTQYKAGQLEPIKSTKQEDSSCTVLGAFVPRSRTEVGQAGESKSKAGHFRFRRLSHCTSARRKSPEAGMPVARLIACSCFQWLSTTYTEIFFTSERLAMLAMSVMVFH